MPIGPCSSSGVMEGNRNKTLEEVWREIHGDINAGAGTGVTAMTLEDFLDKAGAGNKEDVRVPLEETMPSQHAYAFGMDSGIMIPSNGVAEGNLAPASCMQFGADFSNGMVSAGGGGRGKRTASVSEAPLDRLTQRKQRRMIKNRESAARSRQRKKAYTVELEALVTQLKAENTMLLKEEAEQKEIQGAPGKPDSGCRTAKNSKASTQSTLHGMIGNKCGSISLFARKMGQ